MNGHIRSAAAASGQLFAFVIAERLSSRSGPGAALVGMLGASIFGGGDARVGHPHLHEPED